MSHPNIAEDERAFQLTKDMLMAENTERLSEKVIKEYEAAHGDAQAGSEVVERLQRRIVSAFLSRGRSGGYFHTVADGLLFLRGHVGNFPGRHEELKACANYVRYTAEMRAGDLRAGDVLTPNTLQAIPLARVPPPSVSPSVSHGTEADGHETTNASSLYELVCTAPLPTTVLVASSYS